MGQFALGIRSLLIKATVFVIMAALLAWALGGTLWPRAHVVDMRPQGTTVGSGVAFWRLTLPDRVQESGRWKLMILNGQDEPVELDSRTWVEVAQPVASAGDVYFGGRNPAGQWFVSRIQVSSRAVEDRTMPDRLAVEQQLARIAAGLPIQDSATIAQQRPAVLDPGTLNPRAKIAEEDVKPSADGP